MGLAPKSVDIAREILTEVIHLQRNLQRCNDEDYDKPKSEGPLPLIEHTVDDPKTEFRTLAIMVCGQKSTPGAWENVFINLEGINQALLDHFYARKYDVPNSHFIDFDHYKTEGIVRIGFF